MKRQRKFEFILSTLSALMLIVWIAIRLPAPEQVLMDVDGGYQLAGATQILFGEHPFVDFEATYGPFTFYASAISQVIFGNRFVGEIILVTLSYAVSYATLTKLIYRVTANPLIVFFFEIVALAAIPRLYKYYLVLGPALVLWAIWNYIEKPIKKNMLLMALAVTITGLFRSDFGLYCSIAGTLTVIIQPSFKMGGFTRAFLLLGAIFLFALPYILFLSLNAGLENYFYDMLVGGPSIAMGMSAPFPTFNSSQSVFSIANLETLAVIFFFSLPCMLFVYLRVQWEYLDNNEKKMILTATVLYSLSLLQASHRVDHAHLLQAIPLAFILMAWLTNKLLMNLLIIPKSGFRLSIFYVIFLIVLCAGAIFPVLLVNESGWPKIDVRGIPEKLRQYSLSKDRMLATIEKDSNAWYPEMMNYVRRCTNNRQRLMALPALTTFYYFTDRMFGGGQIVIISGYFVSDADQVHTVYKMSQQDIPLIIYLPNSMTDNKEERRFEVIAPIITSYIDNNYAKITKIDDAVLLLRRDLKLEDQPGSLSEFSCPVYKD